MKVCISHNYAAKEWLKTVVVPLVEAAGHKVISRWITEPIDDVQIEVAQDVEDVRSCDSLILFANNYGDRPGRGKFIEFGLALAWGKRCIVICTDLDLHCIFYSLPNIRRARDISEAIKLI